MNDFQQRNQAVFDRAQKAYDNATPPEYDETEEVWSCDDCHATWGVSDEVIDDEGDAYCAACGSYCISVDEPDDEVDPPDDDRVDDDREFGGRDYP